MITITRQRTLLLALTSIITIGIILVSIFSLKIGFFDIFPFFYLLPIIVLAYFYPRYAVYFTVILGWLFLGLVYVYGPIDIRLYATSIVWFYLFVSVGVILSAFAGQFLQQKRYQDIFDNSQAGIFTFHLESRQIREANQQFAHILGYTPEELHNELFSLIWLDTDHETRFMQKLITEKKIADIEVALRKKDRTVIWVLITAALTAEGLVICSAVDITGQKAIKDELIESELRYRMLFDGASDAIFIHDIDGRIFETNLIASGQLGYTKRELMQKRLQDLDVEPENLFTYEKVQRLHARGHILIETVQRKKDGSTIPVEISSRTTEYFGMPAIMSIVRDISERQKG